MHRSKSRWASSPSSTIRSSTRAGDNEWTDCRKPEMHRGLSPLRRGQGRRRRTWACFGPGAGRLTASSAELRLRRPDAAGLKLIRQALLRKPESLGQPTMPLDAPDGRHAGVETAENTRWEKGGVVVRHASACRARQRLHVNRGSGRTRAREGVARNRAQRRVDQGRLRRGQGQERQGRGPGRCRPALFVDGRGGDFTRVRRSAAAATGRSTGSSTPSATRGRSSASRAADQRRLPRPGHRPAVHGEPGRGEAAALRQHHPPSGLRRARAQGGAGERRHRNPLGRSASSRSTTDPWS